MGRKVDYDSFIGKKFNKLTILVILGYRDNYRHCIAICDCGVERDHNFDSVKNGVTKTCGCLKREYKGSGGTHNLSKTPLYEVWRGMKQRCYYPKAPMYYLYGGNGVVVCDEWLNDFKCFYDWAIANGWEKGLHLDKDKLSPFPTGKIYSPKFCCFLTPKENSRIRENVIRLEYKGEIRTLVEWSEILGLNFKRLRNRYFSGWETERILETPAIRTKLLLYNNEYRTLPEWCDYLKVKYDTMRGRIYRQGWTIQEAFSTPINDYKK